MKGRTRLALECRFCQMYCFGSIVIAEQVLLPAHGDGMEDRPHRNGNGRWMEESSV